MIFAFDSGWYLLCLVVSGTLVQLLGVSEKQWETWVEMELAQFSIPFTCRKYVFICFLNEILCLSSLEMSAFCFCRQTGSRSQSGNPLPLSSM